MCEALRAGLHELARQFDTEADTQMNLARGVGDLEHELRTGKATALRDCSHRVHFAADAEPARTPGTAPVITATSTVMDGLVLRWRRSAEAAAEPVVSASRTAVMVHGDATVDEDLLAWIAEAQRARAMLAAGRREEAKALATHRHPRPFAPELEPINPDIAPSA